MVVVFAISSTRADALRSTCTTRQGSIELSAESVKVNSSTYPVGTFTDVTPANELVAGTVPGNGALLKEWPVGDYYRFEYVSVDGSSYSIDVYDASDALVAGGCGGLV